MSRALRWLAPLLLAAAGIAGCVKLDGFLFAGEDASLDDYDFTAEDLDGIDPSRITSELIPSANPDTAIHVIYVERDEAELDPRLADAGPITVVFSHGNRGNMLLYWYRAGYFEDMGFNVLMYDYRGYGASEGETTERHVYEDARTAYEYALARDPGARIISVGYSMGGAPAIWLCSSETAPAPFACFTESAFSSVESIVQEASAYDLPGQWVADVAFDNLARIATVKIPCLLMHGTQDLRVTFENGEDLWSAVEGNNPANRFYPVKGAGHRNVPVPSYPGVTEPREYSHPDELPAYLEGEFQLYKGRIVDHVAAALGR